MKLILLVLLLLPTLVVAQTKYAVTVEKDPKGFMVQVKLTGAGAAKDLPLLYDKSDMAYEKGVENKLFSSFASDRKLTLSDTKYNTNSVWSSVSEGIYIQGDSAYQRSSSSGKYYYGDSANSFLENPRVHPRTGTPIESKKLYVSWWFRPQNDTRDYIPFRVSDVSVNFKPKEGDEFVIAIDKDWTGVSEVRGRVIQYDPATQQLVGNFYGQSNANKVKGKILTMESGGGTALLAEETGWRGANKYIRVWESDGAAGSFRLSWTNTTIAIAELQTYKMSNVIAREWNHMEMFVDQNANTVITKVNGKLDQTAVYKEAADVAGYSPTIGLIGFDASVDIIQKFWMDDIYMDNSFRRITLASSPKYSDVTHEEVQFFKSWTSNEIIFVPSYGSLDRREPVYIYVYDESGIPNQEGIRLESRVKMEGDELPPT